MNFFGQTFVIILCSIQAFQQENLDLVPGSVRKFFYALNLPDWLLEFTPPSLQCLPEFLFPEEIWSLRVTTHISLVRRLKFFRLYSALTVWTLKSRHTFISNALRYQKEHCNIAFWRRPDFARLFWQECCLDDTGKGNPKCSR